MALDMPVNRRRTVGVIVVCALIECFVALTRLSFGPHPIGLDESWLIGLAATLQQGAVSGRDYLFNYGFLAQVIAAIGASLDPRGTAVDAAPLLGLSFTVAGIAAFAIALALIRRLHWAHVVVIYGGITLLGIPGTFGVRPSLIVLCSVLLYRSLVAERRAARTLLAITTAFACVAAQLVAAELGPFTAVPAAALPCVYAALARTHISHNGLRPARGYLEISAVIAGGLVAGNLCIDMIFSLTSSAYAHFFDYQIYMLAIFQGHNNTMGSTWGLSAASSLGLLLVALFAAAYAIMAVRRFSADDGIAIASLGAFTAFSLKEAVVRSDQQHILETLVPLVVLVLLAGNPGWKVERIVSGRRLRQTQLAWACACVLLIIVWPLHDYAFAGHLDRAINGSVPWPATLRGATHRSVAPDAVVPAGLAHELGGRSRPLLAFPYDTYIGVALRRRIASPVLQSYAAVAPSLQDYYVAALRREPNLDIVYGLDGPADWPVDDVQAITRVPIIFEYLYRNFTLRSSQRYGPGYYLLSRRQRARDLPAAPLHVRIASHAPGALSVVLPQPVACSLVRLRVRVSYPLVASLLGRPDAFHLRFSLRGRVVEQSDMVPLNTAREFSTYVSLLAPDQFYRVFGNGPISGTQWDQLTFAVRHTGLFEVLPNKVAVDGADCVSEPK